MVGQSKEIESMMSNVDKFTPARERTKRSSSCSCSTNNSDGQVSLTSWQAASGKWQGNMSTMSTMSFILSFIHSFIHTSHSVRQKIRRKKKDNRDSQSHKQQTQGGTNKVA